MAIWTFSNLDQGHVSRRRVRRRHSHGNDDRGLPHEQGQHGEGRRRLDLTWRTPRRRSGCCWRTSTPRNSPPIATWCRCISPARVCDGRIEKFDLFNDLVSDDGQLSICIQCLECGQSFGMAQPDLYIRAADGTFEWNFVKTYLGIWMQMVLVLSLGVMVSTFVSGPVAVLATVFMVILGVFSGFAHRVGQRPHDRRRAAGIDGAGHDAGQHDLAVAAGLQDRRDQGGRPDDCPGDALFLRASCRSSTNVPTAITWPLALTWGGTCWPAA